MSKSKKIAVGISIGAGIAIVAAVLIMFVMTPSNSETVTNETMNENSQQIETNTTDEATVPIAPGSSTSEYEYTEDTTPTMGDLSESGTSTQNPITSDDTSTYADQASTIRWENDGNYRSVADDPMTDLDPAMLETSTRDFMVPFFFENDPVQRASIMSTLVDLDYVRENNSTSLGYDYKTNWQYSMAKDDSVVYHEVRFDEVESAIRDDGSCVIEVDYTRSYEADDGGGWVNYDVTDIYRVRMSNSGKIQDIEYVGTRQP